MKRDRNNDANPDMNKHIETILSDVTLLVDAKKFDMKRINKRLVEFDWNDNKSYFAQCVDLINHEIHQQQYCDDNIDDDS